MWDDRGQSRTSEIVAAIKIAASNSPSVNVVAGRIEGHHIGSAIGRTIDRAPLWRQRSGFGVRRVTGCGSAMTGSSGSNVT